jgi:hypothetical protein
VLFRFFKPSKKLIKNLYKTNSYEKKPSKMAICEKNVINFDFCARLLLCHTQEPTEMLAMKQAQLGTNRNAGVPSREPLNGCP